MDRLGDDRRYRRFIPLVGIIRSYRDLNSAKFLVIHEMEKLRPLKPYDAEWESVGRGENSKLYLPFTHVEIVVPWIFIALHLVVLVRAAAAVLR